MFSKSPNPQEESPAERDELRQLQMLENYRPEWAIGIFWLLIFCGAILVQAPWEIFHGVLFSFVGMSVILFPPIKRLPKLWWVFATLFVFGSASAFLPVDWFPEKPWRAGLEELGVETGTSVVIQRQFALESWMFFAVTAFAGLWLAGHRASSVSLRRWSLVFSSGVAVYAIASWLTLRFSENSSATFGFFPNRNHTATYLAMGAICGFGCVLQAIRDKRFVRMGLALLATGVCLWAVGAWSISRAGILLIGVGGVAWFCMLGTRYLGRHGIWAVSLVALLAAGMFLISDNSAKQRISDTIDKTSVFLEKPAEDTSTPQVAGTDLDFRIPTALDTISLIQDFKWTGVGAGQFPYIFPQYRHFTSVASASDNVHPESDWLWMTSEVGLPATVFLALLVIFALGKSLRSILRGKDRALRSACLVGAAIVPFHGLFDVPGHRITLAFCAIFLYFLSLGALSASSASPIPRKLPYRFAGSAILFLGLLLLSSKWLGKPAFATVTAATAIEEVKQLYREDQLLEKAAAAENKEYQPDPSEDLLEKSLLILNRASHRVPLDRQIPRYNAFIGFHFDDKQDEIDKAFALERALDPAWVKSPYEQGIAWAEIDPTRVLPLWEEALKRSDRVASLDPENPWSRTNTLKRMEDFAKKYPDIERVLDALVPD